MLTEQASSLLALCDANLQGVGCGSWWAAPFEWDDSACLLQCAITTCFDALTYADCCLLLWVLAALLHAHVVLLHLHHSWHVVSLTMSRSWTASCEVKSPAMGLLKASSNYSSSCSSWLMQHNPHNRHSNSKVMTTCFAAG